ncbi:MAG TPA: radical SAM protein [Roseiarcus sp.]|nr:radical SAM protein [Roseiarcus sp.]
MRKPTMPAEICAMAAMFQNIHLREVDGRHYVFAPFAGLSIEISRDIVEPIKEILNGTVDASTDLAGWADFLREADAVAPESRQDNNCRVDANGNVEFLPTDVTLSLTTSCNLKCVYCYIYGGDENRSMPEAMARGSIDFVADNAEKTGAKSIGVMFHGEGEPTYNWSLFKKVVEYAEATAETRKLDLTLSLQSNGLWSDAQREYIVGHVDDVGLSIDGLAEVQDVQRPVRTGKSSFEIVKKNLIALKELGVEPAIHATVTPTSVGKMNEFVTFLGKEAAVPIVQFDPVHGAGRAADIAVTTAFKTEFASRLLEAKALGKSLGVEVEYSGCGYATGDQYCGATGGQLGLAVMSDGSVSSCYEVNSEEHRLGEFFVYGRYDVKRSQLVFDQQRMKRLLGYNYKNNDGCSTCFAGLTCRGDCLAMYSREHLLSGGRSPRCSLNRELVDRGIVSRASENHKGATARASREPSSSALIAREDPSEKAAIVRRQAQDDRGRALSGQ